MAGYGRACVKTQKRPHEFDRELEEFPGKASGLLMHLLLAQGPPVISQAMFEYDLCRWTLEEFSHALNRSRPTATLNRTAVLSA
jgi:hypothetical protein